MKTGVYTITNIINNKIYVGSASVTFIDRFTSHKKKLKENRHFNKFLQSDWNFYGEKAFLFEILEECIPEFCLSVEQYWINMLNVCNRNYGYNILPTAGNNKGYKHSKEAIEKALKNKKPFIRKIYQYDIKGNFIKEWQNIITASKALNISHYSISMCIRNKTSNAGGFQWFLKKLDNVQPLGKNKCFHVPILQYTENGDFIKEWVNLKNIEQELKILKTNISKVLKGKRNTASGFIWKYKVDDSNIKKVKAHSKKKVLLLENNVVLKFNSCVELSQYLNISTKLCNAILKGRIKESKKLNGRIIKYV